MATGHVEHHAAMTDTNCRSQSQFATMVKCSGLNIFKQTSTHFVIILILILIDSYFHGMECKNPTISTILTSLTVNSRTEQPIRSILEYQLSLGIPTQVNA